MWLATKYGQPLGTNMYKAKGDVENFFLNEKYAAPGLYLR